MGICDIIKRREKQNTVEQNNQIENINNNNSSNILQPNAIDTSGNNTLPNYYIQTNNSNNNKCPQLMHYNNSLKRTDLSNIQNNSMSGFSSLKDQELIIKGEVNKNLINKEEDFDNVDFKNYVKDNGGIIIQDNDKSNNIISSQKPLPSFNIGKDSISEIKSNNSNSIVNSNKNISSVKNSGVSLNLNDNNRISLKQSNKTSIKNSSKISVSINDNVTKKNEFIHIPKVDEPLPDIEELSTESPLVLQGSSLVSEK